jgi:hypothetical protein
MKAHQFYYLIAICLVVFSIKAEAETISGEVRGKVIDSQNKPIEYATVALINPVSNQLEKGVVCNEKGEFSIKNVDAGEYILSVRMLGFETSETERVTISKKNRVVEKTVRLMVSDQKIEEVVVTGKYQFVEQTVDKTVINPSASITSESESVYEILKKSPGVSIDNNDNITLKGMQGVKVLIDDKPVYVSAKDLAPLLKGMLGKNVKSIEIIENPSARYDAEGNSGIINIKTKHNKAPGFNGSVNSGITFTRTVGGNAGTDLNMNFGKVNVYGNYAFYDWKGWSEMNATRKFTGTNYNGNYQLMTTESNSDGEAYNYKVGADYFITKNQVVSIMFRGNTGLNDMVEDGLTTFADRFMQTDSTLTSIANRDNNWNNQTFNVNYKWDIDSIGRSLTFDADYALFSYTGKSNQRSKYFDALNVDMNKDALLASTLFNDIDILSAKLDYVHPVNKTYSIETGLKSSFVSTESRATMVGYMSQNDKFIYNENIQAGYVSGRAQFEKTSIQLGLRVENTISQGNSVSTNQVDKNDYLEVFPSLFIQQKLKHEQTVGFRYSYRIGRPNYHVLNPFIWIIDPYTYNQGNPKLNPQFSHSMSINHSYKSKFMTSVGYSYTTDLYTEVIYQNDETKAIYQTTENFGTATDFNLTETVQLQPTKWWRLSGTVIGMYKEVNAKQGMNSEFKQWSYIGNMSNSFTLPYKISIELSGNYSSKQLIGNFTLKPRYSIDLGMQMRVLNDKGSIRASFSDVFNTSSMGAYSKYGNIDLDVNNRFETQRLNISFNYRFGKSEFKTRSNRSTASSEEQGRSSK